MQFHTFHLANWPDGWTHKQVYDAELDMVHYAEDLGYDGAWIAEHHFRNYGVIPNIMPFAAYVAARTTRIKIGSAIVVLPFHHPLRAAEDAAMVDLLSGGRLMYGFGRGYQGIEFAGFDMRLSEARDRTDEAIDILRQAWSNEPVNHKGQFFEIEDVNVLPKPIQPGGPPLFVASVSPETIGHYAKKGIPFISDPIATRGRCMRAAEEWKQVAAENGHDVSKTNYGSLRGLIIGETDEEAREIGEKAAASQKENTTQINKQSAPLEKTGEFAAGYYYWKDRYLGSNKEIGTDFFWDRIWVAGGPERVRSIVQEFADAGYEHMLFTLGHYPTFSMEDNKRRLKIFAEQVMPHFQTKDRVAAK